MLRLENIKGMYFKSTPGFISDLKVSQFLRSTMKQHSETLSPALVVTSIWLAYALSLTHSNVNC